MSVTTTANPATTQLSRTLADYDIKLTGAEADGPPAALNPRSSPSDNPEGWPTNFRNVPPYRPINRNLDMEERPGGSNGVERIFIAVMLHGVWLNAVSIKTPREKKLS